MAKPLTDQPPEDMCLTAAAWRALVASHPIHFRVAGNSMHPTLKHAESLLIEPLLGAPAAGEVVVYLRQGRLIVHRCLRDGRLRGDGRLAADAPVAAADIIGVVRRIGRNGQMLKIGRILPMTTRYYRLRLKMQLEIGRTVKGCLRLLWRNSSPVLLRLPGGRQLVAALKKRT